MQCSRQERQVRRPRGRRHRLALPECTERVVAVADEREAGRVVCRAGLGSGRPEGFRKERWAPMCGVTEAEKPCGGCSGASCAVKAGAPQLSPDERVQEEEGAASVKTSPAQCGCHWAPCPERA